MTFTATLPGIAGFYGALNGGIFVALSLSVIFYRLNRKQSIIGYQRLILREQRAHANASEYIPLFLVLLALCELGDGDIVFLHLMGVVFTLGRVSHAFGTYRSQIDFLPTGAPPPWHPLRIFGMALTLLPLVCISGYLLGLSAGRLTVGDRE